MTSLAHYSNWCSTTVYDTKLVTMTLPLNYRYIKPFNYPWIKQWVNEIYFRHSIKKIRLRYAPRHIRTWLSIEQSIGRLNAFFANKTHNGKYTIDTATHATTDSIKKNQFNISDFTIFHNRINWTYTLSQAERVKQKNAAKNE